MNQRTGFDLRRRFLEANASSSGKYTHVDGIATGCYIAEASVFNRRSLDVIPKQLRAKEIFKTNALTLI